MRARRGDGEPAGLGRRAHLHLYDKAEVRPGRKMGHVTALGATADEALDVARRAAAAVGL